MSTLSNLSSALGSNDNDAIRNALSAYLKDESVNPPTSTYLKPETLENQCGSYSKNGKDEGVDASVCKKILTDCVAGKDSSTCSVALREIVATNALASGIKNMNGEMARNIVKTLNIDLNSANPVNDWVSRMPVDAGKTIGENGALMTIITNFVNLAKNPTVDPRSIEFSRRRVVAISSLPPRTPRVYITKGGSQNGGGSVIAANTYQQYSDSLKTFVAMQNGGSAHHSKVYDEFSNIYNTFVNSLRNQGKQIDENDDRTIRRTLDDLKSVEHKLGKVVSYISKYEELKSRPELKEELATNPVTVDLLESLNKKYKELKEKHSLKSGKFLSITDALNKIVNLEQENAELRGSKASESKPAASKPSPIFSSPVAASPLAVAASPLDVAASPLAVAASASTLGASISPLFAPTRQPSTGSANKYYSY